MKNRHCLYSSLIYIMIYCFSPLHAWGANPSIILDSAHKAYSEKNYVRSLGLYQKLDSLGLEAPELYYDLANAYYKTGNIPMAILNYERANKLKPDDPDILFNLNLANQHIVDKTNSMPIHFLSKLKHKLLNLLPEKIWSGLSLFFFLSFLFALTLFFSYKIYSRPPTLICALVLLLAGITAGTFAYGRVNAARSHDEVILVRPSITVKGSPDQKGTDLFILHEGIKVIILQNLSGWSEIQLSNGNTGWLPSDSFIAI